MLASFSLRCLGLWPRPHERQHTKRKEGKKGKSQNPDGSQIIGFVLYIEGDTTASITLTSVVPHLRHPGPLQLPLAVGLFVEQGKCFPAGG